MLRTLAVLCASSAVLLPLSTRSAGAPSPALGPSLGPSLAPSPSPGPESVVHMHERLFAAIDRGDVEGALAFLHPDMHMNRAWVERPCTVVLEGIDDRSQHAIGYEASRELVASWVRETGAAANGRETRITRWLSNCFSSELSYAIVEFERTRTVDGEAETRRYVSTSLVTRDGGSWQLTNWHVSPAGEATVSVDVPRWKRDAEREAERRSPQRSK